MATIGRDLVVHQGMRRWFVDREVRTAFKRVSVVPEPTDLVTVSRGEVRRYGRTPKARCACVRSNRPPVATNGNA